MVSHGRRRKCLHSRAHRVLIVLSSSTTIMELVTCQLFTDGTRRPVYDDGRQQWVIDDDGNWAHGVWYIPREECDAPLIVGGCLLADW